MVSLLVSVSLDIQPGGLQTDVVRGLRVPANLRGVWVDVDAGGVHVYTRGSSLQTVHDGTWKVANTRTFMDIEYILECAHIAGRQFLLSALHIHACMYTRMHARTHTHTHTSHIPQSCCVSKQDGY